jgi:hypothetical protein
MITNDHHFLVQLMALLYRSNEGNFKLRQEHAGLSCNRSRLDARIPDYRGYMSIDPSLILNIALGIIVARVLISVLKEIAQIAKMVLERIVPRNPVPAHDQQKTTEADWIDLWESLPPSAKEHCQTVMDDDQLRRRAQDSNLWPYLWSFASEETKAKLRSRWNEAKIPAPKSHA